MTTRRETNHNSHSGSPQIFGVGADATTRDTIAPLNFRVADTKSFLQRIVFQHGTTARHFAAVSQVRLTSSVNVRGVSCVLFTGAPSRAPRGSTDRFCAASANDNKPSKINHRLRTEMSAVSTGRGFGSPIWLLWLSPPRQKRTWLSWLASMRAQLADGLAGTASRLLTRSDSSSAKSCAAITSAIRPRRRPF